MKTFFRLTLVIVVLLCVVLILVRTGYFFTLIYPPPLNVIEVRQILEKCSCEPEIQAEVDDLLSRSTDDVDSSRAPALARFGKTLNNPTWLIEPLNHFGNGMPGYLRLRFGQHSHYQYILFFRTGSDLSNLLYEHVTGNIYFKPDAPHRAIE